MNLVQLGGNEARSITQGRQSLHHRLQPSPSVTTFEKKRKHTSRQAVG
jgi:hypothetical protein